MIISAYDAQVVMGTLGSLRPYRVLERKYPFSRFTYMKYLLLSTNEIVHVRLTDSNFRIENVTISAQDNRVALEHLRNLIYAIDDEYIQRILLRHKLGVPQE